MLLRMLVDLYGLVQIDSTYGVPVAALSQIASEDFPARQVFEVGVHSIWALRLSGTRTAGGDWTAPHREKNWSVFWNRVQTLEEIGAIWYEPWVYESNDSDAEPMFPVSFPLTQKVKADADVVHLTSIIQDASISLAEERSYLIEMYSEDILVPLSRHRHVPSIRGVARLRIEADTPARRLSYRERVNLIKTYENGYTKLARDASLGQYNRPLNTRVTT